MGFIAGCLLLVVLGKALWDFVKKPSERHKMIRELYENPLQNLFMLLWMTFFLMAFVGVFVPPIGEIEITRSGWQVWQVGIIGFFGCWVITFFVNPTK